MNKIVLIMGPPGAGKTTIARQVAKHFPKSLHIQVDDLRDMMVNGAALPDGGFTEEADRQFQWVRAAAIYMAKLYAERGVFVVIDDVSVPGHFQDHYSMLFDHPDVQRILLLPTANNLIERMRKRGNPWDHVLIEHVPWLYSFLEPMPKDDWIVLDTSDWTIEQTVSEVLARLRVRQVMPTPA
jgi:predicted kinase